MTSPGRISGFRSQYQEPSASSMRREPSSRRRARRLASLRARTLRGSNRMIPWWQTSSRSHGVSANSSRNETRDTARSGRRAPEAPLPADGPATEARHRGRPRTRQHARRDGPRTGRCRWPRAPGRGRPTRRGPPRTRLSRACRAPRPGTRRAVVSGRGIRDPDPRGETTPDRKRSTPPRTCAAIGGRDCSSVQVKDRQAVAEQREIELLVLRRQEGVAYAPPPHGSGLRQLRLDPANDLLGKPQALPAEVGNP